MPRTALPRTSRREYNTPHKQRFFSAYDNKRKATSFNSICRRKGIAVPPSTGRRWLKEREHLGPVGVRKQRGRKQKQGKPFRIPSSELLAVLDPEHPDHDKSDAQIGQKYGLSAHTVQQNFSKRANARHYKRPTTEAIREPNKTERIDYGTAYEHETIASLWDHVYFTDEAHFKSRELSDKPTYERRQPGVDRRLASIQEVKSARLNVTVHVAAGISYKGKGVFKFYADPAEPGLQG